MARWTCSKCDKQIEKAYFDEEERICEDCQDKEDNPHMCTPSIMPAEQTDVTCLVCGDNLVKLADGDYFCIRCDCHCDAVGGAE